MSDQHKTFSQYDQQDQAHVIRVRDRDLEEIIVIADKEYLLVPKENLETLLNRLQDYKGDINELRNCVISVLRVLGLLDEQTQSIKEKIKTGEEGYFKHLLSALKDVMFLLTQAKFGFKDAERELLEKFDFVKKIIPLIEKHHGGK
jgi:hypothetical protein